MNISQIKQTLYDECITFVNKRIDNIQEAIIMAKEAANEESRSSMGDKYETGRAMIQIEIENNVVQLKEAQRLSDEIRTIRPGRRYDDIRQGSLVITNLGAYYLSIGAGKISVDEKDYFAVAINSPIGKLLLGKKEGDSFEFNNRSFTIEQVI